MVESWAEHLRQHARFTGDDRAIQDYARSFIVGPGTPAVAHLIAEEHSKGVRRRRHRAWTLYKPLPRYLPFQTFHLTPLLQTSSPRHSCNNEDLSV